MNTEKPRAETKKDDSSNEALRHLYQKPGESPGKKEGLTPTGERLLELNTKEAEKNGYQDQDLPEPTRFGDWESKGRCSDF